MPERMERLDQPRAALTGLTLDAQLEPSHALEDRVVSMAEDQSIQYLDWSLCTRRETEVNMMKKEPVLRFNVFVQQELIKAKECPDETCQPEGTMPNLRPEDRP